MRSEEGAGTAKPGRRLFEFLVAALLILPALALLTTARPWLAFLPLGALLGLLVFGMFPQIAYYLLVFLVPFGAYRKIADAEQVINIPWLVALGLLVVVLVADLPRRELISRLRSNLWPLFAVFFSTCIISTLLSDYPKTAATNLALLVAALGYLSFGLLLVDARGLRRFMPAVLITSISLGSLSAVIGYVFKIAAFSHAASETRTRGTGFATDPNNMSLMVIFTLPLIVFFLLHARTRFWRLLMVPLLLVNVAAVGSTFSRGGFVVLLVCGILLMVEHGRFLRPRHLGFFLLASVVAVVLVLIAAPPGYWVRQKSLALGTKADTAIERRASYLLVAKDALLANPLLGSGPGSFIDIYSATPYAHGFANEKSESYSVTSYRRRAHNTYLEVAVGTGIVGLVVFLLILRQAFVDFSRAAHVYQENGDSWMAGLIRSYRIGFLVLVVYLLIYSDLYHKYLLLSLALSQVSLSAAAAESDRAPEDAGHNA